MFQTLSFELVQEADAYSYSTACPPLAERLGSVPDVLRSEASTKGRPPLGSDILFYREFIRRAISRTPRATLFHRRPVERYEFCSPFYGSTQSLKHVSKGPHEAGCVILRITTRRKGGRGGLTDHRATRISPPRVSSGPLGLRGSERSGSGAG